MGYYTVKAGDTLSRIAAMFRTTWQYLYGLNRAVIGSNPNALRIGEQLTVPGGTAAPAPTLLPIVAAAVRKATATLRWTAGMCDNFCANMYNQTASGYASAAAHWSALPAAHKHPGDFNPPVGALFFYLGGSHGYGHAVLVVAPGRVRTIDMDAKGNYVPGAVSTVPIMYPRDRWGMHPAGWSDPVFGGRVLATLHK